jgi:hypothetical protein
MPLSLPHIRRLAAEVARQENPAVEVFATTNPAGAVDHTEVIMTVPGRLSDPTQLVVGIRRSSSEADVCERLRDRLRDRLRE